jgi:hypothetical protein
MPTTLKNIERAVDRDAEFNRCLRDFDRNKLKRAVEIATLTFPYIEGRRSLGTSPDKVILNKLTRESWQFSVGWAYDEMDRTGLSRVIARILLVHADFDFRDARLRRAEWRLAQQYPNALMTEEDIKSVCATAEKYKKSFVGYAGANGINAGGIFRGHQSPGVKEAGAYIGMVDLAAALAPEPFVSKGIAVASVITGFIAQWF